MVFNMKARVFCSLFILCTCFVFWISAHGLMKRDAGEGKFYVLSSREGCVSVSSAEPCPVSWKLNPYFAKMYENQNNLVSTALTLYQQLGINNECRNDVKATLCSQSTPRCFEDGSRDYGDARTTCEKMYGSCPEALVKSFKEQNFCEGLMTGKHSKGGCVSPPRLINGVCPQPKHKMPFDQFIAYEKQSQSLVKSFNQMEEFRYPDDNTRIYSSECVSKLEEMSCAPLYCSADEKSLLIKHDKADCNNLVRRCFDGVFSRLSAYPSVSQALNQLKQLLDSTCKQYPDATTTETQSAPPTVTPPTSSANSHLPQLVLLLFLVFFVMFSAYDENY